MKSNFTRPFIGMLLALGLSSCVVSASEPSPPPAQQGTLVLRWTIQGGTDPNQCAMSASKSIRITVEGPSGGVFSQDCAAFSTSISLARGDYRASAALVDANNQPRMATVDIHPFTIYGNDKLDIPIDFPASSFR